jgi:predicted nucleotidyltransferase
MKPSEALQTHRAELRDIVTRYGALRPRVFGSDIHGIDTEESDVDLLVDPSPHMTLMALISSQLEAERLLGVRVDVLTPKGIPQRFRDRVGAGRSSSSLKSEHARKILLQALDAVLP